MLEAFLDESSSTASGHPVLIVASFVSEKDRWALFEEKWRETVLAPYKITHLHTKQLRSHNDKLYRHLNLDARKSLLSSAVETIAAHVESAFSIYMRPMTGSMRRRWKSVAVGEAAMAFAPSSAGGNVRKQIWRSGT